MPDPYAPLSNVDVLEMTEVHPPARRGLRLVRPIARRSSQTVSLWEPLEEAAQGVYAKLLGMEVWRVAETSTPLANPLSASVYFAGAWKGALIVECSMAQAMRWAGHLMGAGSEASVEDAADGLTELTGKIAAKLRPMLPRGVSISAPWVVEGSGHLLRVRNGRTDHLEFDDGAGRFRVKLVLERGE